MPGIAAVVGVIDEVDLIQGCIRQLFSIGVDHVIVDDRGSSDGTLEVLHEIARTAPVRVFEHVPQDEIDPSVAVATHLARLRELEVDWALFLDADEFWVPATGRLRDSLASREVDAFAVARYNVPLTTEGPALPDEFGPSALGQLLLTVTKLPDFIGDVSLRNVAWSRGVPLPKVCFRPAAVDGLTAGAHRVIPREGARVQHDPADDIFIAHVPFTTHQRFRRKVDNIARTMELHPAYFQGDRGWHWRRWRDMAARGELAAEFERQLLSRDELAQLRAEGAIVSAKEWFELRGRSPRPPPGG